MKYNINELDLITSIDEKVDLRPYTEKCPEIIDIPETRVTGIMEKISPEKVIASLKVSTVLILPCARSLKEVRYPLEFNLELEFSNSDESDYPLSDPLVLDEIIFGNILAEKPYTVFHESTSEDDFKEEDAINKAFSDLDKMFNK